MMRVFGEEIVAEWSRASKKSSARPFGAFVGALAIVWAVLPAHAQTGLGRDEVLRLPAPLRAAASDYGAVRCDPSPVIGLLPEEEPLSASQVAVAAEGVSVLPAKDFAQLSSAVNGAPASREGLTRLAAALECRYRELGYIFARVNVLVDPAGGEGRYRAVVTEGVVRRLEALADTEALADLALRAFAGVKVGTPLRASEVRRGLAHAASVGLTDLRPTIRRSRLDPNEIDLVLIVTQNPDQLFVQAQNANAESLGPGGLLVGARLAGLTPLEERTTVGGYVAEDPRKQWSVQFDSEALVGRRGLKARWGAAYSRARPGGVLEPLAIDAKTSFMVAELSAPLQVRRGLVSSWRVGLEAIDQRSEFLGGLPLGDDRLRVVLAGVRVDGLLGQGVLQLDLQARRGLDALGARGRGDSRLSDLTADPQGSAVRVDGTLGLQLSRSTGMRASVRAQWSPDSLLPFERLNFGGLSGGHGFDPGALSGDSGLAANVQLFGKAFALGNAGSVRPLIELAAARLRSTGDRGEADAEGASASVGLQWTLRGWLIETSWAEPIGRIEGAQSDAFGSRFLLRVTGSFDTDRRRAARVLDGGT